MLFLPWVVAGPVVGIAAWMLDGVFVGATRTADMRDMMALSAVIYFAAALAADGGLGQPRAVAGAACELGARGATLAWRYPGLERAAGA
jgi:MATE family multidrug resistance protein